MVRHIKHMEKHQTDGYTYQTDGETYQTQGKTYQTHGKTYQTHGKTYQIRPAVNIYSLYDHSYPVVPNNILLRL